MRCQLALAALLARGAGAWTLQPASPLRERPAATAPRAPAGQPPAGPAPGEGPRARGVAPAGLAVLSGAGAALAALAAIRGGRRTRSPRRQWALVTRRADDIEYGYEDPETGEKNFVNPWEQRVEVTPEAAEAAEGEEAAAYKTPVGYKYHEYTGPVYKKVPVVEGLQFPLDPTKYYEPLEPPAAGGKWGEGRAPDGNWYMEVDGKQVQYWQGWGRRKTACAIVRIAKGSGQFIINGRDAIDYLGNYPIWWLKGCEPLAAMSAKNDFDVICKAFGGGLSGQAGAIRYALAKAMQEYDFNWRPLLKKAKYLTRDWRRVEPKKPGQPKARKKTPYHKR